MSDIEIGRAKRGAPRLRVRRHRDRAQSRRTRDPQDVSVTWTIDAFTFDIPVLAAPMDSVVSPATAIAHRPARRPRRARPRGPLDPLRRPRAAARRDRRARAGRGDRAHAGALRRADQARARSRSASPRSARRASPVAGALSPQRTQEHYEDRRGCRRRPVRHPRHHRQRRARRRDRASRSTSRSSSTSSTCPSSSAARRPTRPRCTSCAPAPRACSSGSAAARRRTTRATLGIHAPMATAVADVAGARRDYLDESGGRYVHVIADGGVGTSGDIVKAISMRRRRRHARRRARPRRPTLPAAAGTGAPRPTTPSCRAASRVRGRHGRTARRRSSSARRRSPTARRNLIGALRRSMATTGYSDLKEFQRVEVVVAPYMHG